MIREALLKHRPSGCVRAMLLWQPADSLVTTPMAAVHATMAGISREKHAGWTCPADSLTPF